ncbi:MAG: hypothetical protein M3463_15530 [Verrucomicrobiota bacterium]|nr:hypothetical protein [Verrucomicrobiota bacterium]
MKIRKASRVGITGAVIAMCVFAGAALPAASPQKISNAEAICGTWVLQQVSSQEELERLLPRVIEPALRTPRVRGFCLRVPWRSIDNDFALLDAGLKIARDRQLAFSLRFMAGRHTPVHVFEKGCRFYSSGKQEKVPTPFLEDGSPNVVFEAEYDRLVSRLAKWCRANGVRLLHLAWYGQDWAELNHGKEVRAVRGYSYENWLKAHLRLLDIAFKYAGEDLATELPFSGYGPLPEAASALADHVVRSVGASNPVFFCQANGWGPNGDWGAPNAAIEAAFDRVWTKPICRGQQMIQPSDYDWAACYRKLYENKATYCEVYAPSFTRERKEQLAEEIRKFADYCKKRAPLPESARNIGGRQRSWSRHVHSPPSGWVVALASLDASE